MALIFFSEFEDFVEFCKSLSLAVVNAAGDSKTQISKIVPIHCTS